jgi:hypothetical protein
MTKDFYFRRTSIPLHISLLLFEFWYEYVPRACRSGLSHQAVLGELMLNLLLGY